MAGSLNKVILIGNVGKDPEIRTTNDGREIASFSLATGESWKDRATGERKERTEWHRIVVFNEGLIGVIKNYVQKGSKLYLEGNLQTRKWQDQEGKDRYTTEVVLQNYTGNLTLLGSRNQSDTIENQASTMDNNSVSDDSFGEVASDSTDLDEDIPF